MDRPFNPLIEYKKEGYEMFKQLLFNMRRHALINLMRAEVRVNNEMES